MTAIVQISELHNEYRLQGTLDSLLIGPAAPKMRIYDDTGSPQMPALITDAATGNLLVEVVLEDPVGTIDNGELAWAIPDDALVMVTGDAFWAEFVDGNGDVNTRCTVTGVGGDGPIRLVETHLLAGSALRVAPGSKFR
ncbi:MAG TPA: hypothetical protein VGE36_04400 [Roseateles sp.]